MLFHFSFFCVSQDFQVYTDESPTDPGFTQQSTTPPRTSPASLQGLTGKNRPEQYSDITGYQFNNLSQYVVAHVLLECQCQLLKNLSS